MFRDVITKTVYFENAIYFINNITIFEFLKKLTFLVLYHYTSKTNVLYPPQIIIFERKLLYKKKLL